MIVTVKPHPSFFTTRLCIWQPVDAMRPWVWYKILLKNIYPKKYRKVIYKCFKNNIKEVKFSKSEYNIEKKTLKVDCYWNNNSWINSAPDVNVQLPAITFGV